MNTYYLKGMGCPDCGSDGPFVIQVTASVTVADTFIDLEDGDTCEWHAYSPCACEACGASGEVGEFKAHLATEPDTASDTATLPLFPETPEPATRTLLD